MTTDSELAGELRAQLARLNQLLAEAAQARLLVELRQTAHQTGSGVPMLVVEATIYKQI